MNSRTIIMKKPSKSDRDESRFVLVSNLEKKWLDPHGLYIAEDVLQENGKALGPIGLAVYVAWQFLEYMGQEPSISSVAAYLGCQKVTVKKQVMRLEYLGLIEEQVD